MSNTRKKILSMLLGFGLISVLLYSLVYILTATTPSLAIPPKTATPTPTPTPTPTSATPTPTPTPTPPTTGRLEIQTIPQDDQLRKKGIILATLTDFHAEYKIDIRQNGVNVDAEIQCIVLHKEVCNPKVRQSGLITEEELTEVTDISDECFCLFQQAPGVPGVGVINLFCSGSLNDPDFWGDHVLKVVAGVDGVVGSEIQDLCVIASSNCIFFPGPGFFGSQCHLDFLKEPGFGFDTDGDGDFDKFADPIFPFASCKGAALFQRTRFGEFGDELPQCTFQ